MTVTAHAVMAPPKTSPSLTGGDQGIYTPLHPPNPMQNDSVVIGSIQIARAFQMNAEVWWGEMKCRTAARFLQDTTRDSLL